MEKNKREKNDGPQTTKRRAAKPSDKQKVVVIQTTERTEKRISIPDNATITFGGLIPGAKVDGGSNRTALRIYVGKDQIAVFTGIQDFRVMEHVKVMEKVSKGSVRNVRVNENGVEKTQQVHVRVDEWKDADTTEDETPQQKSAMAQARLSLAE